MLPVSDPNPLLAGVSYTISLWIAFFASTETSTSPPMLDTYGIYYQDQFPLALFGNTTCVPFPIGTEDCIGYMPGWTELGRVYHQPSGDWQRVSITFTPAVEIQSVILGSACDLPSSFAVAIDAIEGPNGPVNATPYALIDELMLTLASDQMLTPVSHSGHVCGNNVVVTATPPAGATDHQWYLDGVALVGQTGTSLDASALGLGSGLYAITSDIEGECLMGSTTVPPAIIPAPEFSVLPAQGCAPLTVSFTDTTGLEGSTIVWDLGDGTTATGASVTHTYTTQGTYDLTLQITSAFGCSRDSVVADAVEITGGPIGVIDASPDPAPVQDPMVTLNSSNSSGGIIAWWWDLGSALPASATTPAVTATFPSEPGVYDVILVVTNAQGCTDTVHSVITITDMGDLEMPNVFSPNNDGENDVFIPMDHTGTTGLMEIYDRWGQLIFSTSSLAQGWNGISSGHSLPAGTYYYIITPDNDQGRRLTGHVTLIR